MRVQRRTATAAAALAAAGLAVTTVAAGPAFADNPNNSQEMRAAVTVDGVMRHLEAFQEIADENDGNRGAGTAGYDASGEYVEKVLRSAGYETERQYFDFVYDEVVSTSLDEVSPDQRSIEHNPMSYSPSTPGGGVTAALAAPTGAATGCETSDWAGFPAGSIALVSRGVCAFAVKSQMAKAAGAPAAIVYNNGDGALNGTLGGPADNYAPITGVTKAEGATLLGKIAAGGVTVKFDLQKIVEDRRTFNLIAETTTGRDDNVVMLGAHLDSVHDGAGINDNGSGSAGILETAVQLAKVNKLNNKVRFAWWGAEELGLLGSEHYVGDLAENNEDELDRIATYLNFDMIASPNFKIGVYDADQSTYKAPVTVPKGSIETEDVLTSYFDGIAQPWVDTEFSGRSDYQAFIEHGVPASGLFTGGDGVKTAKEVEMFGGTAGITYDPNYHSPADDITNVNSTALDIMSDAIAHATITLAQSTESINGARSAGRSGNPHPVEDHLHEDVA
ncbi:M20/M25/M40 family metallo-hydrolase [Knoellia sp. p5-6-4]|uniref:M20/M25/M40 family metallo-hydrolase n=1 Tax=unclassified Knoellia TaxID=2618719 RepID=UPI0023D9C5F2|nr:M20/M25/M40 family metallo-hydrolase [Knoellia sp. p5-6-4]MDF2145285.1 M20/M25/M40 family metallo-hydrolase [Knoellia sp. p5-6-4]